jgi:hypothetical protein
MNTLPRFHGQPIQHHAPSGDGSVGPLGCTAGHDGEDAGSSFQSYVERLASHAPRWTVVLRCARPGRTGVRRSSDTAAPTQRLAHQRARHGCAGSRQRTHRPASTRSLPQHLSTCGDKVRRWGSLQLRALGVGTGVAAHSSAQQAPARSRVDYTRCPRGQTYDPCGGHIRRAQRTPQPHLPRAVPCRAAGKLTRATLVCGLATAQRPRGLGGSFFRTMDHLIDHIRCRGRALGRGRLKGAQQERGPAAGPSAASPVGRNT